MDIIINIIWDVGKWVVGIGAALLVIVLLFNVARYGMSAGNPQSAASARAAIVGCVFGLLALPSVLLGYRLFYADVIAPSTGGDAAVFEVSCNRILMRQLQVRPNIDTAVELNGLIRAMQVQKEECAEDGWKLVLKENYQAACGTSADPGVKRFLPLHSTDHLFKSVDDHGFGREPGYIVMIFDISKSTGLSEKNDCWGYSAELGRWVAG